MKVWIVSLVLGLLISTVAASASAQEKDETLVAGSDAVVQKVDKTGWHPMLKVGGNFALGQTSNVPGSADGVAINFGALVTGGLSYLDSTMHHEWASDLMWQLAYARTPVVDAWVKSADGIDLKSAYLYHIPAVPWFGPFFSLRLTTPMMPGYEVRPGETTIAKLEIDEAVTEETATETIAAGDKIDLTPAFSPLTLRETLGLFAIAREEDVFKLDTRLGFSAWETFVRDGYQVADDEATADIVELRRMQDAVQLGPELGILATGLIQSSVTYSLGAMFMQPVYHTAETDLEGFDLLNMEFTASLGIKALEFLSIDYAFKALKQPLVVNDWQITNNLLITISFMLVGEQKPAS